MVRIGIPSSLGEHLILFWNKASSAFKTFFCFYILGGLFGEDFIVKQIVPLLRNVVQSCIGFSFVNKPEPVQSWNALALIDCLITLDGVIAALPKEVIVKELIEV